jgi:dephospho-CoA kinase
MSDVENFAIVGLTGGIASGKSLVAGRLAELGVPVVDADLLAREIVEPEEPAWQDILREFGDAVIREDRTLDRQALGALVFADDNARKKLEAITHPRIAQRLMQRAAEFREAGRPWIVYDAALLVENGAQNWLDALIVVSVDPEVQIERLMQRDQLSRDQARQRIDAQMPLAAKIEVADYVIDNNGSQDDTLAQVDRVFEKIQQGVRGSQSANGPQTDETI